MTVPLPNGNEGRFTPDGVLSFGDRLSKRGSSAIARKEGRFCWLLADFVELHGGELCIAGRVSVGDLSEVGMVNFRSIGDIATESESSFPDSVVLEGEGLDLDPSSLAVVLLVAVLEFGICERVCSSETSSTLSEDIEAPPSVRIFGRGGRVIAHLELLGGSSFGPGSLSIRGSAFSARCTSLELSLFAGVGPPTSICSSRSLSSDCGKGSSPALVARSG